MKREYERLVATDPAFAAAADAEKEPAPAAGEPGQSAIDGLFNAFNKATPDQQSLVGGPCRGWLEWMEQQNTSPSALDPVILDFRNRELAKRIEAGPEKIYITYGTDHLRGLLATLQASDPAWAVGSVKWMRTIETPENLEGEIK